MTHETKDNANIKYQINSLLEHEVISIITNKISNFEG